MSGRRAIVTGATAGIGRAYATELARRGWAITAVARDAERLRALIAELGGPLGRHDALPADLATIDGCNAVATRLADADVALLVNAAGVGTNGPFSAVPLDAEQAQLDINVRATMRLSWAAAGAMRDRGAGAVVNIASTAAIWSTGTYAASKAWVLFATEGLAASLDGTAVRALCVVPGFTRTEFHARSGVDNSGVRPWLWLTPEQVVGESLHVLETTDKTVCIPSTRYKLLVAGVRLLPGAGRRSVLKRLAPLRAAD